MSEQPAETSFPAAPWGESHPLAGLRGDDLRRKDAVFHHGTQLYRTTGQHLSHGGMGSVYLLERRDERGGACEEVVGKIFHPQYLYQLRTDEVARRDFELTVTTQAAIGGIGHPSLLPIYACEPVADNHLLITPRKADTLLERIARGTLSPRRRVALLIQALEGLAAMHEHRIIHRDFTLRNILVDREGLRSFLFDFDLALPLDHVIGVTYGAHYQGRIFGSPGFSVAPEIVDDGLADRAITPRLDVYAIGGALFRMFSDHNPHGETQDMWGLLMRIADGLVIRGHSHIEYPSALPAPLRPIIERCLERDPGHRIGSVNLVIEQLAECLGQLDDHAPQGDFDTIEPTVQADREAVLRRARSIPGVAKMPSVTPGFLDLLASALQRYGYRAERSFGQIDGKPLFLAAPIPELVASGQFPYANTYPKIVTAINLNLEPDTQAALDRWFGTYLPVLEKVRQGSFTSLYKAIYDEFTGYLLLFSEFVDDPRFGSDLAKLELGLIEAFALGFWIARQVGQLHEHALAHNNITASSLLLKGLPLTRRVVPSMAGLVEPSSEPEAMRSDVRDLAGLVVSWLHPEALATADFHVRDRLEELRDTLAQIAAGEQADAGIDLLFALVARGLSLVDPNFQVLRENRGDLEDYVQLRLSHRLYHRLWPGT